MFNFHSKTKKHSLAAIIACQFALNHANATLIEESPNQNHTTSSVRQSTESDWKKYVRAEKNEVFKEVPYVIPPLTPLEATLSENLKTLPYDLCSEILDYIGIIASITYENDIYDHVEYKSSCDENKLIFRKDLKKINIRDVFGYYKNDPENRHTTVFRILEIDISIARPVLIFFLVPEILKVLHTNTLLKIDLQNLKFLNEKEFKRFNDIFFKHKFPKTKISFKYFDGNISNQGFKYFNHSKKFVDALKNTADSKNLFEISIDDEKILNNSISQLPIFDKLYSIKTTISSLTSNSQNTYNNLNQIKNAYKNIFTPTLRKLEFTHFLKNIDESTFHLEAFEAICEEWQDYINKENNKKIARIAKIELGSITSDHDVTRVKRLRVSEDKI